MFVEVSKRSFMRCLSFKIKAALSSGVFFSRRALLALVGASLAFGCWGGYQSWLAVDRNRQWSMLQHELEHDRGEIRRLHDALDIEQQKVALLASRLGLVQARLARLDALGRQLVASAKLDAHEFDFGHLPSVGGPMPVTFSQPYSQEYLTSTLARIEGDVEVLDADLNVVDFLLEQKQTREQARPHHWPTRGGWISSRFGIRADPFTGLPAPHKGVDIANAAGAPVLAAARGVVVFAGKMVDFGYMVDVDHGHGFVTRYGHLSELKVRPGDIVEEGAMLGRVGSSGRSTGPHLHFEVHRYGQAIDPTPFLSSRG